MARDGFSAFLLRCLFTLAIPQGYTLSISGSFAVAVNRYGLPADASALLFVAGAVSGFVAIAVAGTRSGASQIAELPVRGRVLLNVVPLVVVTAALACVRGLDTPYAGFFVAGLVGAAGYVVLLTIFLWFIVRVARTA